MRFLFVLILLAGIAIGLVYPWAMTNFSGHEVGSYRVYEQGRFKSVTVALSSSDAPVRVLVDLTARAERIVSQQRTILTLTAATGGKTVLASTLQFNHSDNPRQVDHFIYFSTEPDREYYITYIQKHHFKIESREKLLTLPKPFKLQISRLDMVDLSSMSKLTLALRIEAEKCRGDYDGWETLVIK